MRHHNGRKGVNENLTQFIHLLSGQNPRGRMIAEISNGIVGNDYVVALCGLFGLGCVISWPHLSCYRKAVAVQSLGAIAFSIQFSYLGATTAAAASMLSCTQLICAVAVSERRFVQAVTGVSALVLAFMAVATWQGVPSLLALIGGLAGSVARLQPTTKRMKLVFLAGAPFWVAHNLLVGATFASCVDVASIGGNLSSLWRTRSNNNVLRAFATALQPFGRMSARIVRS